MRYFFHFETDQDVVEDKNGELFKTDDDALVKAKLIASEVDFEHGHVRVVDSNGRQVAVVPVTAQGTTLPPH